MPCMENFAAQDADVPRAACCRPACRARVVARGGQPRSAGTSWVGDLGESDRDGDVRRVRARRRALQALRLHARAGRRRRPGGRRARAFERGRQKGDEDEHDHRAESAPAGADRGGRERLARPDPPLDGGGRRARADGRRGVAARRDLEPGDLREGDPRARPTTTRICRRWRARSSTRSRSTSDIAIRDVQLAADVLARSAREPAARDGFVSLEVAPDAGPRHRGHARAGARVLEARRPAERDDQDPGDARGRARRSSRRSYEGINVNVTLLFAVEAYEAVAEAYIRGARAPPRRGQVARRQLGGELLRLARGHATSTSGSSSSGRDRPRREGGARQRARRVPALQGDLLGRALGGAARGRAPRCSGRCGRRPATKNPHYPDTMYVDGLSRRTRSTRCRCRRCWRSPTTATVDRADGRAGPGARICDALAEAGIDLDRGHRRAAASTASSSSRRR